MHTVIRIILPATDEEDAISRAQSALDSLVGEGKPFDWCTMFNETDAQTSGPARYAGIPPAARMTTAAGKELVANGMQATKDSFMESMTKIREAIRKYADEEILNEKPYGYDGSPGDNPLMLIRHYFRRASAYEGSEVFCYDKDGSALTTQAQLDSVLENYGEKLPKGEAMFVVPVDVHF